MQATVEKENLQKARDALQLTHPTTVKTVIGFMLADFSL